MVLYCSTIYAKGGYFTHLYKHVKLLLLVIELYMGYHAQLFIIYLLLYQCFLV